MLRMDQVHVIRHKCLVEGKSRRQVARELGVSVNTVRRYLKLSEPRRVEAGPRPRPVFAQVQPRIDALLEEWGARTTAKQKLTAVRLWQQLRREGFDVGVTLVREYLAERRRAHAEVFVPLEHQPGDEAQVDFFEVTIDVGRERRAMWMFVMRLMHSGRDFAWVYEHCDQVSFLDGHARAFQHFGAVPHRCIYDNLSAAVRRVLPKRDLTHRFAALASHYLFEPCFARVATGHDKGGVESRGRGIRWQHLTPIPAGGDLASVNAALLQGLDSQVRQQSFLEDHRAMLPLNPAAFECARLVPCEVRSTATVRVEGAVYSLPTAWARRQIRAYVGVDTVRFVLGERCIIRPRQQRGGKLIRYLDYLPELARKPQAVRQVAAPLLQELGEPYASMWRLLVDVHGPRDAARVFAKLLEAVDRHGGEAVAALLAPLMTAEPLPTEETTLPCSVPVPAALAHHCIEVARARDYDALLLEAVRV
jgi:transposase